MAHTGRYYKVAFRRDWNLNVDTNRLGIPDQLGLRFTVVNQHCNYPTLQGQLWNLQCLGVVLPDTLFFLSDDHIVQFTRVHVECHVQFTGSPQGYLFRWFYVLNGIGTKLIWETNQEGITTFKIDGDAFHKRIINIDSLFWGQDPFVEGWDVLYRTWTGYQRF